ncbi:hypothetical protein CBL_03359 [Carabus blaptoides fortunei]
MRVYIEEELCVRQKWRVFRSQHGREENSACNQYEVTAESRGGLYTADSGRKSNYPLVRRVPHCHGNGHRLLWDRDQWPPKSDRAAAPAALLLYPGTTMCERSDTLCVRARHDYVLQVIKADNLLQTFPTTTDTCQVGE